MLRSTRFQTPIVAYHCAKHHKTRQNTTFFQTKKLFPTPLTSAYTYIKQLYHTPPQVSSKSLDKYAHKPKK